MDWSNIISKSNPLATIEDIAAFERELGVMLPASYKQFLLNFNGGAIVVENTLETTINEELNQTTLWALYPLSDASSFGVKETRRVWHLNKFGIEAALPIGNDGGAGFFFLMLSECFFGQIFYAYGDEYLTNGSDWKAGIATMPDYMGLISQSFSELAKLIELQNRLDCKVQYDSNYNQVPEKERCVFVPVVEPLKESTEIDDDPIKKEIDETIKALNKIKDVPTYRQKLLELKKHERSEYLKELVPIINMQLKILDSEADDLPPKG